MSWDSAVTSASMISWFCFTSTSHGVLNCVHNFGQRDLRTELILLLHPCSSVLALSSDCSAMRPSRWVLVRVEVAQGCHVRPVVVGDVQLVAAVVVDVEAE